MLTAAIILLVIAIICFGATIWQLIRLGIIINRVSKLAVEVADAQTTSNNLVHELNQQKKEMEHAWLEIQKMAQN